MTTSLVAFNSVDLLKKLVDMAGGPAAQGYVLARDGQGLGSLPTTLHTSRATYSVCRHDTELGLRRTIWKSQGAPLVAVIPQELEVRLSRDVLRRARGGRVHTLDLTEVLSTALGIQLSGHEEHDTLQLAFEHLEALREVVGYRTLPTLLDHQLLDELLIEVCVDPQQRLRREDPGELLARWLRAAPVWETALVTILRRVLPQWHGHGGRLLAWALEAPGRLEALFVHGVLLAIEGELPPGAWGELGKAVQDTRLPGEIVRKTASALALRAVDSLGEHARPLLQRAESLANPLLPQKTLLLSTVLPLSLKTYGHQVAQELARGEQVPVQRLTWMKSHRAALWHAQELAMLEEMARLSRYLAQPQLPEGTSVAAQIDAYQRHGAFADVSAARIRRSAAATASYHSEAEKILARYRERRDRDNLLFARRLAAGYVEALSRTEGVTPLHRLWVDLGIAHDREPLYVIVLDGCSYPAFLELLEAREMKAGLQTRPDGLAVGLPALSLLPTVTSHARGAIFLGESPHDAIAAETLWKETGERVTDPARFQQNKSLGSRTRKLFLKGDLADGVGPLLAALGDTSTAVVAVVFNAIDDQIGSSNTGALMQVQPEQIMGFLPSLDAAFAAGRKVLVTADHGHTPFWHKSLRIGAGPTPRYTSLGPDETAPEGFVEIDLGSLDSDGQRKAFAHRMGAYQGGPQVGFHGGCGLEEMVVPLTWLVKEGLSHDKPLWWHSDAIALASPASTLKVVPPEQQPLFESPPLVPLGLPLAIEAGLQEEERQALRLLAQFQTLKASDLAKKLRKPAGRLNGWMTQLNKKLHDQGVTCFRTEKLASGEHHYVFVPPAGRSRA